MKKKLMKFIHFIAYHLYQAKKMSKAKVEKQLMKYYIKQTGLNSGIKNSKTTLVFMIDGRILHGGLSDRLRGIVSTYLYAQEHGYDFKIYHRYPFLLEDFLMPNEVDWHIDDSLMVYDLKYSQPVFVEDLNRTFGHFTEKRVLDSFIKNDGRQYHVYTNIDLSGHCFHHYFKSLFKLSAVLNDTINKEQSLMGKSYISFVFRFQQLLGDFKEGNYPELCDEEKEYLIERSIAKVKSILSDRHEDVDFLVTSDSETFLKRISKEPKCHIISGKVVHMDYTKGEQNNVYMKSFVDLLMLSKSEKIYLMYTHGMHKSGFALRAALLGNVDYEEIKY